MSSLRRFRFPIFIGAGVITAGVLVYMTSSHINPRLTQGAIGKREVLRDAQVNAADVKASPGSAPVAASVLLQSKEFKTLAKNQAFHNLLSSPAFASIAQNSQFLLLLQNADFLQMLNNAAFEQLLNNGALSQVVQQIHNELSSGISQNLANGSVQFSAQTLSALNANSAQQLATNQAFQNLMYNANFLAFMSNQLNSQALASLTSNNFAGLLANSQFLSLLNQSAFLSALQSGSAASLAAGLQQGLAQ